LYDVKMPKGSRCPEVHGEIVASDVAGMHDFFSSYSCAQRTLGSSTFGARIHAEVFAGSSTGALADLLSRFSCPTVPAPRKASQRGVAAHRGKTRA
jgi:hypothetical protein